jgi:hypothetical protein
MLLYRDAQQFTKFFPIVHADDAAAQTLSFGFEAHLHRGRAKVAFGKVLTVQYLADGRHQNRVFFQNDNKRPGFCQERIHTVLLAAFRDLGHNFRAFRHNKAPRLAVASRGRKAARFHTLYQLFMLDRLLSKITAALPTQAKVYKITHVQNPFIIYLVWRFQAIFIIYLF